MVRAPHLLITSCVSTPACFKISSSRIPKIDPVAPVIPTIRRGRPVITVIFAETGGKQSRPARISGAGLCRPVFDADGAQKIGQPAPVPAAAPAQRGHNRPAGADLQRQHSAIRQRDAPVELAAEKLAAPPLPPPVDNRQPLIPPARGGDPSGDDRQSV